MPKIVRPDGTVLVKIISPGQGSSAYYERAQIERDGHVFKGTQVYWDHPSKQEARDRPERSLRDMCGVAVTDPIYQENGPKGEGLYSAVKVFKPYRPLVEEMGEHIGISIRANGNLVSKQISGKKTAVAERFVSGGFDFVTKAGRGGGVVPLKESAQEGVTQFVESFLAAHPQESEESDSAKAAFVEWSNAQEEGDTQTTFEEVFEMPKEEGQVKTLTEQNQALTTANTALTEQLVLRDSVAFVTNELAEADLPDITKERLLESLPKLATVKDSALDEAAFKTVIDKAIVDAKAYVEALTKPKSAGRIVGLGNGAPSEETAALKTTLKEAYLANGIPEERAEAMSEIAARGR